MGLSRLQVEAFVYDNGDERFVCGWCSEFLNPLSGQRGTILVPLPLPVPAIYKVTLNEGAILRSDVELPSPQIGRAPLGCLLSAVGRSLTEHPADHCLERLRLAGDGGWISLRLNKTPPNDSPVVQFVGVDDSFDPNAPGLFHLESMLRVRGEQAQGTTAAQSPSSPSEHRSTTSHDLSSVDESDDSNSERNNNPGRTVSNFGSSAAATTSIIYSRSACRQIENRNAGRAKSGSTVSTGTGGQQPQDLKCLICLSEERTATVVHGETGHIACCLVCARILKARSDPCPVCRLPIDSVIQHFWA